MSGRVEIIPINLGSDGDHSHRPDGKPYRKVSPPTLYLEKLGALWMSHLGKGKPGYIYSLDQLPYGYSVWERPRPGKPSHFDKWCYGHPSGFKFDSPNRFFRHFLHLMENDGSNVGCQCNGCAKGVGSRLGRKSIGRPSGRPSLDVPSSAAPLVGRPKGRPWVQGRTDDEGTPDVYRNCIDKLKKERVFDALIKEDMSMDWRVERASIASLLEKISRQPSYLPRLAELVLFVRKLRETEEIRFDTGQYKIWNNNQQVFTETPKWEAGVVTQLAEEECSVEDLMIQTAKTKAVNYAGFRIELLPDPNSDQKTLSKQYFYVYLNQIRPFVFWSELLARVPIQTWSPTIKHALTVMSTVVLVEKYRFKGSWPAAKIFNRGIYIGSEFICEGDFVRLQPTDKGVEEITDILKVETITLNFTNLDKASNNDYDDGHSYNSAIYLTGTVYTLDKNRAFTSSRLNPGLPVSFGQYGRWFQRTEPSKLSRVPFHRVIGRCYDPTAIQKWHPDQTETGAEIVTSLSTGLMGVREARQFSTRQYIRISDGKTWLWEESRAQALDLHEINGYETAAHDEDRDPKEWRKQIRILDGTAGAAEREEMQDASQRVLVRSSMTNNSMVTSALRVNEDVESATEADQSRDISRKGELSDVDSSEGDRGEQAFSNQMEGLPMNDEQLPDSGDEDKNNMNGQDFPRGGRVDVEID